MNNFIYNMFKKAKKEKNIKTMGALYLGNPNEHNIALEYAKLLIEEGNKNRDKQKFYEAEKIFVELLDTRNRNYALLELGKLQMMFHKPDMAKKCFEELLHSFDAEEKDIRYATLELGRTESRYGSADKARKYFNSLINDYGDTAAILELAKLEIENGNFKLGEKRLYKLINDKKNIDNSEYAINLLIVAYLKNNQYTKLVKLIEKNNFNIKYRESLLLSKELNIFFKAPYKNIPFSYNMNQIVDYDEYMAIEHIIDRHNGNDDLSGTIFNHDIDIYKLFVDIKKELTNENKNNTLVLNDIYTVYYPNIGVNGENYLRIVTVHNTKNILSMYPIKNKNDIFYVDDEDEIKENKKIKSKKEKINYYE